MRLCLQACCFRAARPVLDKDVYEFPASSKIQPPGQLPCSQHDTSAGYITDQSELSAATTYRDPLLYFLYGAMIYVAMKEWHRAIPFLEAVLTAPSRNHASRIQVEAYKKWVLVNLLAHGQVVSAHDEYCSLAQKLAANLLDSPARYPEPPPLKLRSKSER